jgi:SEC-C motif-containing protein
MSHEGPCPCNSGKLYSSCCKPLIAGDDIAATAEALMRSRYTAYVQQDADYLLNTWHPSTRPPTISPASMSGWCDLHILRTEAGGKDDTTGVVAFKATAIRQKHIFRLHEISRFVKEEDQWLYVDGELLESPPAISDKVGRNDPCPCGSGKKYKKCCGL